MVTYNNLIRPAKRGDTENRSLNMSFTKLEALGIPGPAIILSTVSSSSSASTERLRLRRGWFSPLRRRLPDVSAPQADTDRSREASVLGVRPRLREKDRWCLGCFGVSPLVLLELNKFKYRYTSPFVCRMNFSYTWWAKSNFRIFTNMIERIGILYLSSFYTTKSKTR